MFSGRMTVALVAAGAAAKKLLPGVRFSTRLTEIDGMTDSGSFERILNDLRLAGDTAGGVVEIRAQGVAAGTGEPFFDSIEVPGAHLIFSIPGVKGIEFEPDSPLPAAGGATTTTLSRTVMARPQPTTTEG